MKHQPIGNARLNLHARRAADHARNADLIAKLALEDGAQTFTRPFHAADAGDERTLRGIPAIGRGCPGRINGTDPATQAQHAQRDNT